MNRLYYGDNLEVLRRHIRAETVDLVYLDPPFKSGKDYNIIFGNGATKAAAQIQAFEDTWHWGMEAEDAFHDVVDGKLAPETATALISLRKMLGESDMMAYLCMMAPRVVELHRVLKPTGGLYLHCDPTASHYLKVLLDSIFGNGCFRNEVIWRYRRWPAPSKQFQKMHDVLLFYSKASDGSHIFNELFGYEQLAPSTIKTYGTKRQVADFSSGHRKPSTVEEESRGPILSDVWEVSIVAPSGKERLGYPTQKPEALLERVIKASSNQGDLVLDPFCGCGTAIAVAEKLGRKWVGIDITHLAINLIRHRMIDAFGQKLKFDVVGEPETSEDAIELAKNDRFQFQFWALGLVGARPDKSAEQRGRDRGIDGKLFFYDYGDEQPKEVVLSVKSGHPKVADVRDLRGVLDRESATLGALILLESPTREMVREAASAGFHESPWGRCPRLQLLTIGDLLAGKSRLEYPLQAQGSAGRRKATRSESRHPVQQSLPFGGKPHAPAGPGIRKPSSPPSGAPGPRKAAAPRVQYKTRRRRSA